MTTPPPPSVPPPPPPPPPTGPPPAPPGGFVASLRRHRVVVALATGIAAVLVAGVVVGTTGQDAARSASGPATTSPPPSTPAESSSRLSSGGGGSSRNVPHTTAGGKDTVDAALDRAATGVHVLVHLDAAQGLPYLLAQYRVAEGDFRTAAQELRPAPQGVPADVAGEAVTRLTAIADGLHRVAACFEKAGPFGNGDACAAEGKRLKQQGYAAGVAMAGLLPYSHLSPAELQRKMH